MQTETTNYEQQAIDFLNKVGATIEVKYLKTGKHFDDDKEERDIYEITISRGSRKYTFNFGQSIRNSGRYTVNSIYGKNLTNGKSFLNEAEYKKIYAANRFSLQKNDITINKHYSAPNSYDILACVTKYNPGTFEDFCGEFGYDTDSRKAEKTYNAVKDEYLNISRLFNENELTELQEIN